MQNMFINGEFCKGILHGINEAGNILAIHFPSTSNNINDISDKVQIEN